MKILQVIQRYGEDVFGGAEQFVRKMSTQLVARGHEVDVVTSCAKSYFDWDNVYEPGVSVVDGVTVRRFAVEALRDWDRFGPLNGRLLTGWKPVPLYLQEEWLRQQGPVLTGFEDWMWEHATDYDVVVFSTYLYWPTWAGLRVAAGRVPTVLHPLAHDEPTLSMSVFDTMLRLPSARAYLTEEEADLVDERSVFEGRMAVTGIGMDLDIAGDAARFRQKHGLGDRPYLVSVGRIDPHKGSQELLDFFRAYKARNVSDLALVMVGEPVTELDEHPDVIVTGFVDDAEKDDAVAGATVFVQPSYFESFSMVLTEAWAQRIPALVNGHSAVLAGQAKRSGGALPYQGFAEFETALQWFLADTDRQRSMGEAGRAYVESRYAWDAVMEQYEQLLTGLPLTAPAM